ncbi:unnamed protein product [Hermetia illucens]|uniref:Uncharacterized protein n=2 Tax=Hermetia illucens TaxID=343691 RepID=A0A7R8UU19_HERIL|nr:unnamed protein product [Hermetia illucens]
MIQALVQLLYLSISGYDILQLYIFDPIEANAEMKEQFPLNFVMKFFDKDAAKLGSFMITGSIIVIIASILGIIGALKLYKWLLIPLIIVEFARFIMLLSTHITVMILWKKKLNLGVLIAATVAGGFLLLLIGYMWAAVVAFFQILQLIRTDKYKALYGDDPLHPRWNSIEHSNQAVEKVRMYKTPNFDQITPLKNERTTIAKKQPPFKDKAITTIQINEPNIEQAVREFRNWYGHELPVMRKSNLIRFA